MRAPGRPGGPFMDELNENDVERRLAASPDAGARVVLAEADAPGSLHYLLEAEGFHVVGCASDERELSRVLGQGLDPDVIVLDADIAATSVLVARDHAPEAHVIAIWPDDVSPPAGRGAGQPPPRLRRPRAHDPSPPGQAGGSRARRRSPELRAGCDSDRHRWIRRRPRTRGIAPLRDERHAAHRHLADDGRVVRARRVPLRPGRRPAEDRRAGDILPGRRRDVGSDHRPSAPVQRQRAPNRRRSRRTGPGIMAAPGARSLWWRAPVVGTTPLETRAPRSIRVETRATLATKAGSWRPRRGSGRPRRGSGRPRRGSGRPRRGSGRPRRGSGRPRRGPGRPRRGSGRPRWRSGRPRWSG